MGAYAWQLGLRPSEESEVVPSPEASSSPTLTAHTARGTIVVEAVAVGIMRIRILDPGSGEVPHSYAVEQALPPLAAKLESGETAFSLSTTELTVSVDARSGAITASNSAGMPFVEESATGYAATGKGYRWQLKLPRTETCHGLGQRAFPISLRDRKLGLWNHDAGSYEPGADPLYLSVPFYLGHRPDLSYGIFWDNPARGSLDLDTDNDGLLTYECERRPANIYLISGDGPQQVVQRFTRLTGLMELPPLWALGYHQSRWSYRDEAHYRQVAARMRAERIPCDALHFDIDYMDGFRVFTWDRSKFPNPGRLLADLAKAGFQTVAILDPGIKSDPAYPVYREGKQKNLFLTSASGRRLTAEAWAGKSEFPDFTDPACRHWWAGHVEEFAKAGFAGMWNDMNEPSIFAEPKTIPDNTPHDWDGEGSTHAEGGHAVYGMQMARASREGLLSLRPDRRPFVISRAGYAGLQRFATTWNGDSLSTWEHLQITIPQLLNLGMSGLPFSGSDAGGFRGDPDSELYLRWMQLASMTPFFRTHSARTAPERNPWTYGAETTDRIRAVVELRYRLLPYFYTVVQRACTDGVPILRPMFFERPDLPEYQRIDDQFMLGDDVLVAPMIEAGARSREVVLPSGSWYRIDKGAVIAGDRTITDGAGMGLPIYIRAGTVLPTWPVRQSTSEPVRRLILCVYAGEGESRLYEDAGDGFDYRDNQVLVSRFTTRLNGDGLTIEWTSEGDFTASHDRIDVRVYGLKSTPTVALVDGVKVAGKRTGAAFTLSTRRFRQLELGG